MNATVGGRYRLEEQIGAGGMGRVFRAVDEQTGRPVAAKVMITGEDENLEMLLRFHQEAALLSALKHPNIVEVIGSFLEDGSSTIVMELLDGPSLYEVLREEKLPLTRIREISGQVALALAYAHQRGVVHRDIKPSNIMVLADDRVKVADFGIARVLQAGGTLQTRTGNTLGTPLYMAPEQIEGQKVDGRADIYSLGAVMYQMVTNHPPFEGDDPLSVAFKHVHKPPPLPSQFGSVPADWERFIMKMLEKDPAKRQQSAAALAEGIAELSDGSVAEDVPATAMMVAVREPEVLPAPLDTQIVDPKSDPLATRIAVQQRPDERPSPEVQHRPDGKRTFPTGWIVGLGALVVVVVAAVAVLGIRALSGSKGTPTATSLAIAQTFVRHLGSFGSAAGQFKDPEGVALDSSGNIFVADFGNNRVQKFSPSGKVLHTWNGHGGGEGTKTFNGPTGVAVDRDGNLYVADSRNARIVKLSPKGILLATMGSSGTQPGQFRGVHSLAIDSKGDLYIADFGNNRVEKFAPGGTVLAVVGGTAPGSAPGQFNQPVGLALDAHDNVYVADFGNNRIQKLSPQGKPLAQFAQWGQTGTGFARPHGVTVSRQGLVYVADYQNNIVQVLSSTGKPIAFIGSSGSGSNQFNHPVGVAVDGKNTLYVADSGNNRIQILQ